MRSARPGRWSFSSTSSPKRPTTSDPFPSDQARPGETPFVRPCRCSSLPLPARTRARRAFRRFAPHRVRPQQPGSASSSQCRPVRANHDRRDASCGRHHWVTTPRGARDGRDREIAVPGLLRGAVRGLVNEHGAVAALGEVQPDRRAHRDVGLDGVGPVSRGIDSSPRCEQPVIVWKLCEGICGA